MAKEMKCIHLLLVRIEKMYKRLNLIVSKKNAWKFVFINNARSKVNNVSRET
jgi:hypothetical protein